MSFPLVGTLLLAVAASPAPQTPLALVGGTLIDVSGSGTSTQDVPNAVIVIEGGVITAAGPRKDTPVPAGARSVSIEGTYVLPGLVDAFAGMNCQAQANAHLYMGVTSIVALDEPGGRRGALFREAQPKPHLLPLEAIGERRAGEPERPLEELLLQVDELARSGTRVLLLYYPLRPDETRAIVRRAHALGLATIGELGTTSYTEAIDAGVDAFVHVSRYALELAPPGLHAAVAADPFGPPRTAFYELLSRLDPEAPAVAAYARRLAASSVALIPTLSLYAGDLPGHDNPWREPIAAILDPKDIHLPLDRETGKAPPAPGVPAGLSAGIFRLEARFCRAGARYVAGSGTSAFGTLPGIGLHGELKLLTQLGLQPRQALAAATSNTGQAFRWPNVGAIRKGSDADLLVLDADPTKDILNLRAIRMVVLDGAVVDREALLKRGVPSRDEARVEHGRR